MYIYAYIICIYHIIYIYIYIKCIYSKTYVYVIHVFASGAITDPVGKRVFSSWGGVEWDDSVHLACNKRHAMLGCLSSALLHIRHATSVCLSSARQHIRFQS